MAKNRPNVVAVNLVVDKKVHELLQDVLTDVKRRFGFKIPMCRLMDRTFLLGIDGVRAHYGLEALPESKKRAALKSLMEEV